MLSKRKDSQSTEGFGYMKVKYTLRRMDSFLHEMLKADINKYRFEIILSAKKVLKRLEKDGYLTKAINRAGSIKIHKDTMEFKAREIIEDIDNIINFETEKIDDATYTLSIYINPDYFLNADVIKTSVPKFMMKRMKIVTRQSMIDDFESAIHESYTLDYSGEIIEDDGDGLTVKQ